MRVSSRHADLVAAVEDGDRAPAGNRMSDHLPWQRGDKPGHFISILPEGRVELWKEANASALLERGWRFRITVGETTELVRTRQEDKQVAADEATRLWPNIVRKEQARVAAAEAKERLHRQIVDAYEAGIVDVMAFGLGSSDYHRLMQIMEFIKRRNWLEGPLRPLRDAVSEELYRRRTSR
jgi:hypothetical protein